MRIWLINNYNMLPEHGHLNRNYFLGKYLKKLGNNPVAFVGSHPHNTDLQLIKGKEPFRVYQNDPFPWVLIKTRNYEGSRIKRVLSMFEFYRNTKRAANTFERPDAIIGSSAHPLAALLAIVLGRKYGCKKIVEIRDLWPESIVAYGIAKRTNPLIKVLYWFEKYLYTHADEIVFTMENAKQYLFERGLDKVIDMKKIHYINNGVDLVESRMNRKEHTVADQDLINPELFCVVYTGSIRKVNNIGLLLDAAKKIKNRRVRFLIWGDGDEVESLKERIFSEAITNVVFKGSVQKKYIPYITANADLNIMHNAPSPVLKYGLSANKLFDYAAAEKPILSDFPCGMNPATEYGAGITVSEPSADSIALAVEMFASMNADEYQAYCDNAKRLAKDYSYENLANKLENIILTNRGTVQ